MKTYAVKDIFDTLQGEGARAGAASVFVRFAGCNLWDGNPEHRHLGKGACAKWCDTAFAGGERLTAAQILERMDQAWPPGGTRWCVLTGGEPLLQVDADLCRSLRDAGWRIAVETNGSVEMKPGVEPLLSHVAISPKRGAEVVLAYCDELKVVLPGDAVNPWTTDELHALANRLSPLDCFVQPQDPIDPRYVQVTLLAGNGQIPEASSYGENLKACIALIKEHPYWRLGVQMHKIVGLP